MHRCCSGRSRTGTGHDPVQVAPLPRVPGVRMALHEMRRVAGVDRRGDTVRAGGGREVTLFDTALAFTLAQEGSFVDNPADPGGATNKGITLATFREYQPGATVDELRAISDADVWRIYRLGYWNRMRCGDLPAGVGLSVFDFGVNAGPVPSARMLQWASGL